MRQALILCAVVAALAGCTRHLVPAPEAQLVPGLGPTARVDGVVVTARTDAWSGRPETLPSLVTPVLVAVDNGGSRPVRLRHEDFTMLTADGRQLVGRGPYGVTGTIFDRAPTGYAYPRVGFGLGLGYARRPWGLGLGWGPYYDPFWWDDYYYPTHVRVALPTADMVQMGLPETVLPPGGRAAGFIYFNRVTDKGARVNLHARLVDEAGQPLGTAVIPFVVE